MGDLEAIRDNLVQNKNIYRNSDFISINYSVYCTEEFGNYCTELWLNIN